MTDNSLVFCEAFELSDYKEDSDLVTDNSLVLLKLLKLVRGAQ